MQTKIIENKENNLLNRREVKIIIEREKNPNMEEAAEIVAKELKAEKEKIAVKKVGGKFGRNTFLITAFVYSTKEDKEKIEPKSKKKEQVEKQEVKK